MESEIVDYDHLRDRGLHHRRHPLTTILTATSPTSPTIQTPPIARHIRRRCLGAKECSQRANCHYNVGVSYLESLYQSRVLSF